MNSYKLSGKLSYSGLFKISDETLENSLSVSQFKTAMDISRGRKDRTLVTTARTEANIYRDSQSKCMTHGNHKDVWLSAFSILLAFIVIFPPFSSLLKWYYFIYTKHNCWVAFVQYTLFQALDSIIGFHLSPWSWKKTTSEDKIITPVLMSTRNTFLQRTVPTQTSRVTLLTTYVKARNSFSKIPLLPHNDNQHLWTVCPHCQYEENVWVVNRKFKELLPFWRYIQWGVNQIIRTHTHTLYI